MYTSTDGYTDQFGGVDGTKFMVKHYKELLLEIHEKPMAKQKEIIAERMELWRGNFEQIDDIIVIGVRI